MSKMNFEDEKIVSPYKFANQFREELIIDLKLCSTLCCPKCVITYVDGSVEGCCYYSVKTSDSDDCSKSCDSDSSDYDCDESNHILNCVFDYDRYGILGETTQKEVDLIWINAALKECKRFDETYGIDDGQSMYEKWSEILTQVFHK